MLTSITIFNLIKMKWYFIMSIKSSQLCKPYCNNAKYWRCIEQFIMTWYQFRAHFQFEMICKSLIGSSLFHLQGIYVYDLFPSLVLGKRMKITQLLYNYTNLDINHYFHIPSNFVIIFIILCINSRSKCMYV